MAAMSDYQRHQQPLAPLVRIRSAAPLTPLSYGTASQGRPQDSACFFAVRTTSNSSAKQLDVARGDSLGDFVGPMRTVVGRPATLACNPTRNTVSSRYTSNDWANFNKASHRQSSRERSAAEQTRADAWVAMRDTDVRTRLRQGDVSKKLSERVEDIEYWLEQLASEAELNSAETEDLTDHIRVLESYIAYTAKPLNMSEQCLALREQRMGIDLVHDEVERQLSREVEIIRRCQDQMRKMAAKSRAQLKINWTALQALNKDLLNKNQAQAIDHKMCHLSNSSAGVDFHPGAETAEKCVSIPHSWARHSQENIGRSLGCRAASERQRRGIADLLRACANEMWSQFIAVNAAFATRIKEVTEVRNGLQAQMQGTLQEIAEAERSAEQLRRAVAEKAAPMMVAQTRLEERAKRQDMESCNDPAMTALQLEVSDLKESLNTLAHRLKSVESVLSRLHRNRTQLEADIRVKENSLLIDARRCLPMRQAPRGAQQLSLQARRSKPPTIGRSS